MLSSSSSATALERGGSSSSFSKVMLRVSPLSLSSRKRGRKWFRPRLVAFFTLLLAAVWGQEAKEKQPSSLPQQQTLAFPEPPYAFAHRGASGLLPEHTMQAYKLAVEQVLAFFPVSSGACES
jgi:hypothetical protein